MYCTSCGRERKNNENYCTSCGHKFEERKEEFQSRETGPKITNYQSEAPIILTGVLSLVFWFFPFFSITLAIASVFTRSLYLYSFSDN